MRRRPGGRAHPALGPVLVEEVLAGEGELEAFRVFQRQPFQRTRPVEAQLHRFFASRAGGKERFAPLLVARLDPDDAPMALREVLDVALARAAPAEPPPRRTGSDTGDA